MLCQIDPAFESEEKSTVSGSNGAHGNGGHLKRDEQGEQMNVGK